MPDPRGGSRFERSFELGLPVESAPELLERLRDTPARLEERVRDLPPARLAGGINHGCCTLLHSVPMA